MRSQPDRQCFSTDCRRFAAVTGSNPTLGGEHLHRTRQTTGRCSPSKTQRLQPIEYQTFLALLSWIYAAVPESDQLFRKGVRWWMRERCWTLLVRRMGEFEMDLVSDGLVKIQGWRFLVLLLCRAWWRMHQDGVETAGRVATARASSGDINPPARSPRPASVARPAHPLSGDTALYRHRTCAVGGRCPRS